MNNFHKTILTVILSLFSLTASSQYFMVGSSYVPISCTVEQFDSIWAKEKPYIPIDKIEYEGYTVMTASINRSMTYTIYFTGDSEKRFLSRAIVDKIVPSKKLAKKEVDFVCKFISKSRSIYYMDIKRKNELGFYNYKYSSYIPQLHFYLISFKDDYGLIHCSSMNEYPTPQKNNVGQ